MTTKETLRKEYLRRRLAIPEPTRQQKSESMWPHLDQFLSVRGYRQVFVFQSIKGEAALAPWYSRLNPALQVGLPVVQKEKNAIAFFHWQSSTRFVPGPFGIPEPDPKSATLLHANAHTLILVPALAVAPSGYRLGYGGGYYDRFIASHPFATYIAVVYSELADADIPIDTHDRPVDFVLTENGIRSPVLKS